MAHSNTVWVNVFDHKGPVGEASQVTVSGEANVDDLKVAAITEFNLGNVGRIHVKIRTTLDGDNVAPDKLVTDLPSVSFKEPILLILPEHEEPVYGVKWRKGAPFCQGVGASWYYQESTEIKQKIKTGLESHFQYSGNSLIGDKTSTTHPLFFVCSCAGSGKSRLLDKFRELAINVTSDNQSLNAKMKESYELKVDLENGTSLGHFDQMSHYVTSRIYHQVIDPKISWEKMNSTKFQHLTFIDIARSIAEAEGKIVKDMTFVVLVDGLQKLSHTPKSKESVLYSVLAYLADISNSSCRDENPFVVVCIAATLEQPIDDFLAGTRQLRFFLTPPRIDGHAILQPKNDVERLMISDMGGNGSTLEMFSKKLPAYRNEILSCNTLMNECCYELVSLYAGWSQPAEQQLSLIRAILSGQKFTSIHDDLGNYTVDMYQHTSLVWLENEMLTCPFIWLRIICDTIPQLRELVLSGCALTSVASNTMPSVSPIDKCWQHWEDFVARFWCFKTAVFDGCEMTWQSLHSGALFKGDGPNMKVVVKKLTPVTAVSHCETNQRCPNEIRTDYGIVKPREMQHHIISVSGNPGGDSFCFLRATKPHATVVTFSLSCKNEVKTRTKKDYLKEYQKATSGSNELFVEYSTGRYPSFTSSDLPNNRCGLVCEDNFKSYFGPFSGRAFVMKNLTLPNINTSSRTLLLSVDGIGETIVSDIIEKRKRQHFKCENDAIKCVSGLGLKKAKLFVYDAQ